MNCHTLRDNLLDLVQSDRLDAATETHLRECAACKTEYDSLRATMLALDAWEAPEPSPYFDQKLTVRLRELKAEEAEAPVSIWQTILGYARKPAMGLGIAALLIAGVMTYNASQPDIPRGQQVAQGPVNAGSTTVVAGVSPVDDLQTLADEQDIATDFDLLDEIHTDKSVANF